MYKALLGLHYRRMFVTCVARDIWRAAIQLQYDNSVIV